MDSRQIALKVAGQLVEHRNRLAGKADDVNRAHEALDATAKAVAEQRDAHQRSAATATSHWTGGNAASFDGRAARMTRSLDVTAASATRAATIVGTAASTVDGGHRAVTQLVEEYTDRAVQALDAGRAVRGAGAHAALL